MKTLQTDMGQLSKNRINVLIAGKFLEILNEREEQELEEWLSANPETEIFTTGLCKPMTTMIETNIWKA